MIARRGFHRLFAANRQIRETIFHSIRCCRAVPVEGSLELSWRRLRSLPPDERVHLLLRDLPPTRTAEHLALLRNLPIAERQKFDDFFSSTSISHADCAAFACAGGDLAALLYHARIRNEYEIGRRILVWLLLEGGDRPGAMGHVSTGVLLNGAQLLANIFNREMATEEDVKLAAKLHSLLPTLPAGSDMHIMTTLFLACCNNPTESDSPPSLDLSPLSRLTHRRRSLPRCVRTLAIRALRLHDIALFSRVLAQFPAALVYHTEQLHVAIEQHIMPRSGEMAMRCMAEICKRNVLHIRDQETFASIGEFFKKAGYSWTLADAIDGRCSHCARVHRIPRELNDAEFMQLCDAMQRYVQDQCSRSVSDYDALRTRVDAICDSAFMTRRSPQLPYLLIDLRFLSLPLKPLSAVMLAVKQLFVPMIREQLRRFHIVVIGNVKGYLSEAVRATCDERWDQLRVIECRESDDATMLVMLLVMRLGSEVRVLCNSTMDDVALRIGDYGEGERGGREVRALFRRWRASRVLTCDWPTTHLQDPILVAPHYTEDEKESSWHFPLQLREWNRPMWFCVSKRIAQTMPQETTDHVDDAMAKRSLGRSASKKHWFLGR